MFILPSLYKSDIPYAKLALADWYFIFVFYLMPTTFIGFLPSQLLYIPGLMDHRLLTFMLALPLPFIGPRIDSSDFWNIPGIKLLCLVALSVVLRAIWTYVNNVPVFEIFAVLRWNLIWPIYSICLLHYASRLPIERLYAILRIFLILFSVHVILASISLLTNIDFFLNKVSDQKAYEYIERGLPVDNLKAFPMHIFAGTAFLFILFIRYHKKWSHALYSIAAITLPLLFTRRMYSIIIFIQTASIYSLSVLAGSRKVLFRIPIIILGVFLIVYAAEPTRVNIWFEKMMPVIEEGIEPENVATYLFRENLLEDSIVSISNNEKSLFGVGYQREYNQLRGALYSYALGEDAPIASVIFCEGWGGLFLRIFPYLFLMWCNIRRFITVEEKDLRLYAAMVIGVLISQIPAYLQTAAITHFEYFYVPFAIVELIILKINNLYYPQK
ncbi:MAG TPA: hypothetical protein PK941_14955 [Paludibacter sp.]|nr:hypothetical protein [Paludibacter sp.]